MQEVIFKRFNSLEGNEINFIDYFIKGKKKRKYFNEFHKDVKQAVRRMACLGIQENDKVGIIGDTSYNWMVLDFACIIFGVQSISIPETFSPLQQSQIENKLKFKWCFIDIKFKNRHGVNDSKKIFFNCVESEVDDFELKEQDHDFSKNRVIKDYSIVFSSGTSEKLKYITASFEPLTKKEKRKPNLFKKLKLYFKYKGSIWFEIRGKKNKIIIFLPFSHLMQREFASTCLGEGIDIILSDPQNCIKHIMLEKPNIMISVPPVYDAMAALINARIAKFTDTEKSLFNEYLNKRINEKSNKNKKKQWYQDKLFKRVSKIYGGKADLFITGSAPIKKETLETFYKVGVKIYEAYGQSELSSSIMNNPKNFKIGSIGKPSKKLVKISKEGEVLIKFSDRYDKKNYSVLKVENGFVKTGDTGYFDKDGFLFLTGRTDDIIVLATGKKIFPQVIEGDIEKHSKIEKAIIYENGNDLYAIVYSQTLKSSDIAGIIRKVNKGKANFEQILKFTVIDQKPTLDNGLLTGTMKFKRSKAIKGTEGRTFLSVNGIIENERKNVL